MTRTMYDSTNVQDDPADAQLVGYYVDGIYAVSEAAVRARFPNAVLVAISAIGTNAGIVGDVEPGCITIPQSVDWVLMRRAAGLDPTLYVNQTYGWALARQAFFNRGIPQPHWWVANYDDVAVIPAGAVAKQYANPTLTHGHFDLSVVADIWPGVDGLFGPTAGPLGGELDMATADQILAAVTMPPPPRPDAKLVLGGVPQTDAQLIVIANGTSWANILTQFGPEAEAYIYALMHPTYLRDAVIAQGAKLDALVLHTGAPVDLSALSAQLAAIKADDDAIKAQLAKDLAS